MGSQYLQIFTFEILTVAVEGRKEMFYLTTHSTHFIYSYMASDMVKDHSDSEKGNPLPHKENRKRKPFVTDIGYSF